MMIGEEKAPPGASKKVIKALKHKNFEENDIDPEDAK